MARPENPYSTRSNGILQHGAFEEGVDAGRKWGHEEKDEEWREEIRKLLRNHTEYLRVAPSEKFVPVEYIEALL